ncbi:MAG: recombinase family protein [Clostridiales bacterium]|nr:MAG: recombinase family protein [Clostridiales bacterium]
MYADEGISGTQMRKRPEFMRLMRDARLGKFDMVVTKDISRMARNVVDFLQSIKGTESYRNTCCVRKH